MYVRKTLVQRVAKVSFGLALALQLCPVAAWATEGNAVAAEGDAVAVEEVLPEEPEEVIAADPAEEAEAAPAEEAVAAQQEEELSAVAAEEPLAEEAPVEDGDVNDEPALTAQATTGTLYFGKYYTSDGDWWDEEAQQYYDYQVIVYDVTAGDVTYDEATSTLTLNNATIEGDIRYYTDITINLVGTNTCGNLSNYGDGSYTIKGSGSLKDENGTLYFPGGRVYDCSSGTVSYDAATKTLTLNNATIEDGIYTDAALTINLVGANSCDSVNANTLTTKGTGSLQIEDDDYTRFNSLTVAGGKLSLDDVGNWNRICSSVKVTGGELAASSGIYSKNLTVTGGKLTASYLGAEQTDVAVTGGSASFSSSVSCKNLSVSGGTMKGRISCKALTVSGSASLVYKGEGKNNSYESISCDTLVMKGGSISVSNSYFGVSASKSIAMSGGSITVDNCKNGVELSSGTSNSNFTMSGGTITATDCDYGVRLDAYYSSTVTSNLTISGGRIIAKNPSNDGIYLSPGNLTMTGGTISITGAYETGISVSSNTYRGKTYGGKAKITGGSVTSVVRKPESYSAISANSMTNKLACLKKIVGRLPNGAKFKVGGNAYKIREYSEVALASYGSKKTAFSFNTVKYGSYEYRINGVESNAFNTTRGKKVKSITFKNSSIRYLGKNAFKGTSSLTSFKGYFETNSTSKQRGNRFVYTVKRSKYASLAKGSLSGMGKSGGRGLTIKTGNSKEYNTALRKYLRTLGLPAGVKVKEK